MSYDMEVDDKRTSAGVQYINKDDDDTISVSSMDEKADSDDSDSSPELKDRTNFTLNNLDPGDD